MSDSSPSPKCCQQCGAAMPDAPEGLCPRCLMAQIIQPTQAGGDQATIPSLTPVELAAHFPQLEIIEYLGRGGMGVVYKARQKSLGRLVALKLLAPEREKDPQFAERFAREAQALAQLDHPHIVTEYDFGQTNGFFYLLMEFVDGVNLRQLLQARKLTPEEALAIVPPLCEALQFAHERGIVHRDIKPENLLLGKDGRVKIADFGIAKMLGAEAQMADEKAAGTPGYMAPEQMETPPRVNSRADIYSLGVVFYEMLTGELPAKKLEPPSRKVTIDVRIDEIVLRALEVNPELRFATAAEFRTQVETIAGASGSLGATRKFPVTSPFGPLAVFALLYCCFLGLVIWSAHLLPEKVASHFDGNGVANRWMNRGPFLCFIGMLPFFTGGAFALVGLLAKTLPTRFFNRMPNRAFWLAPEHRQITAAFLLRRLLWLACLLTGFFGGLHWIVLLANRAVPPHLANSSLLLLTIALMLSVIVCAVSLLMWLADTNSALRFQTAAEMRTQVESTAAAGGSKTGKAWHPERHLPFWLLALPTAIALLILDSFLLYFYVPTTNWSHSYGYGLNYGQLLMTANALLFCVALDVAVMRALWVWAHAAPAQPARIWRHTRPWWATALCCLLLPWLLLPAVPRILTSPVVAADATSLSQQGWELWQSGKNAEAIVKFKDAIQLAPNDANAWSGFGWASFNSGRTEEAEKAFQKVIALNPDHPAGLNGLGQIHLSRRDYAKAEPVLLEAAAQRASAAWHGLARLYLLEGKFADAEKWAQMVEDSGQADPVAKQMLKAAKARTLSEGLRQTIEPLAPGSER